SPRADVPAAHTAVAARLQTTVWEGRGSAGTPEAEAGDRERRGDVGTGGEDPGELAVRPVSTAKERTRKARGATAARASEAAGVETRHARRARPVGAGIGREIGPVRHPLVHVADHVERAPVRVTLAARARVHRPGRGDVAVGRPVVRTGIGRALRGG